MFLVKPADSTTNSQVFMPRASFIRPLSQQRPTSFNHFSPNPHRINQKSPVPFERMENTQPSQYYIQARTNGNEKMKLPPTSAKVVRNAHSFGPESLESLKNSLQSVLQKTTIRFSQEISKQSHQIKKLEKKIQLQNQEIQTKNNIIKTLIHKFQQTKGAQHKDRMVQAKKIEDLQVKVRLIVQQFQEESQNTQQKLEVITQKMLVNIGGLLQKSKSILSSFLNKSSQSIEEITGRLQKLTQIQHKKILLLQSKLDYLQNSLKILENIEQTKETCSQINVTKDTASHSSMSSNKAKKEDLFVSDYFFHPSQTDNPSIKAIEELARQRQKSNQLPIRVYLDNMGRLKYFQSRTFIFDRKGNFTTPTITDLSLMEQKGWIKTTYQ